MSFLGAIQQTGINGIIKRVWRYQMGNQNSYIEEEQTTQWPKERQRSTKHNLQNQIRLLMPHVDDHSFDNNYVENVTFNNTYLFMTETVTIGRVILSENNSI
jgi:hypothetical protein